MVENILDNQNIVAYIGKEGIKIRIGDGIFTPKWFLTKDLHPLNDKLQLIRDYVNSQNLLNTGTLFTIPINDEIKKLLKIKNDWKLFNILVNQYINSVKGFEYFMNEFKKENTFDSPLPF